MLTVIKSPFKLFPEYLPCIENTVRSGLRKKGKSIQKWKERCVSNFTLSKRTRKNLSIIPSSRDLSKKKRKKHTLYFPYSIPLTITDFNRSLSRFDKISSIGPSEISKGKENSIPGHEETKSRLTGALDGAREKPLSLSRKAGGHSKKRERERSCALPSRTRLFVICQGVCLRSLSWRSRYPIIAMAACFLGRGEGKNRGRLVYSTPRERERRMGGKEGATKRKRAEEAGCLLAAVTC